MAAHIAAAAAQALLPAFQFLPPPAVRAAALTMMIRRRRLVQVASGHSIRSPTSSGGPRQFNLVICYIDTRAPTSHTARLAKLRAKRQTTIPENLEQDLRNEWVS